MAQIAFVSDAEGEAGKWGPARATALYSARLDGSGVRRLTYNPSGAFDPAMLPDGRMLMSAWRTRNAASGRGRIDLFGINIDGTDYAAFSGDQGLRFERIALRHGEPRGRVRGFRYGLRRRSRTTGGHQPAPEPALLAARDVAAGQRLSPAPLADGTLLVARKPVASGGTYGIWRLDPATRKLEPVFDSPENHELQPQALEARALPDGRSVVDETQPWAKLYGLKVYESDLDQRPGHAGWSNGYGSSKACRARPERSRPCSTNGSSVSSISTRMAPSM